MVSHFKKKQNRNISKNNFFIKIFGVLILIVFLSLVYADFKIYKNKQKLISQLNDYKRQIQEIEERNRNLEEGIAKSDDKDFIEKVAREEFGMQQPGENVVAFVTPEQNEQEVKNNSKKSFFNIGDWPGWFSGFWQAVKDRF
jgi:cell division protein FtsL